MKIFQKNLMVSEDVKANLGTGVYYENDAEAPIHDGALVEIGDIMDHTVYAGMKDANVRKITAPTAGAKRLAIVDYVNRSHGNIMGVEYREGVKTAGLSAEKGEQVRYRIPGLNDTFWLGDENFSEVPTEGAYATSTEGDTIWTVSAEAPTEGLVVKIENIEPLTEGTVNTGKLYFCTVISL